jgi:hypothetical protein
MSNERDVLKDSLQGLILLDVRVDGCETFLSDVLDKLKGVGGKATDAGLKAISDASKAAVSGIVKTLGTRRMFIAHTHNRLSKENLKDELTFNSAFLKKVTRDGKPADIIDGLVDLQKTMDLLKSFLQDVEAYSSKELALLGKIDSIKTTEDAVSIINGLESLKFPKFGLPDSSMKNTVRSELLPGGKMIWFDERSDKTSLVNFTSPGEEVTESFGKDDVKSILVKLNKLVETYQYVVKALNQYDSYTKKFNTVLGKSFAHLDTLKGDVSAALLTDLRSHLEGNTKVFTLYSGFLPQLMIYLDDYVDTLSSYLSKQFN